MSEQVEVLLMDGVEGPSLYINDYRVAGPKPWGGGTILREWKAAREDVLKALGMKEVGTHHIAGNPHRAGHPTCVDVPTYALDSGESEGA